MGKVRTRFAPSPTGYLHVGSLRTALYDYLFAKKNSGDFILRIEDTDQRRYVPGATENLIKVLKEVGLEYDEGPIMERAKIVGHKGEYGPYLQSERFDTYQNYAQRLVESGHAYYCFCSEDRLKEMRDKQIENKQAPKYDGHCRSLSKEEVEKKLSINTPYVIRMKVPDDEAIEFDDLVRGKVRFSSKEVDDQILVKSDGYPTYHLAVVVDDHFMKVSHIIRGEEWLSSTPKHILLYKYFGWEAPQFAHIPLLLNPDKSKLSKRQGDVAVEDYLNKGYLPEALLNFVALLGWNPTIIGEDGKEREIFSLEEMAKYFSWDKVNKSGAVFNIEKLDWINGYYIRQSSLKELAKKCIPFWLKAGVIIPQAEDRYVVQNTQKIIKTEWLEKVVELEQARMKKLSEIVEATSFVFIENLDYEPELLAWKSMANESIKNNLRSAYQVLNDLPDDAFESPIVEEELRKFINKQGIKPGEMLWPLRVALTGRKNSPGPFEVAGVLGREESLQRIEEAMEKL